MIYLLEYIEEGNVIRKLYYASSTDTALSYCSIDWRIDKELIKVVEVFGGIHGLINDTLL